MVVKGIHEGKCGCEKVRPTPVPKLGQKFQRSGSGRVKTDWGPRSRLRWVYLASWEGKYDPTGGSRLAFEVAGELIGEDELEEVGEREGGGGARRERKGFMKPRRRRFDLEATTSGVGVGEGGARLAFNSEELMVG